MNLTKFNITTPPVTPGTDINACNTPNTVPREPQPYTNGDISPKRSNAVTTAVRLPSLRTTAPSTSRVVVPADTLDLFLAKAITATSKDESLSSTIVSKPVAGRRAVSNSVNKREASPEQLRSSGPSPTDEDSFDLSHRRTKIPSNNSVSNSSSFNTTAETTRQNFLDDEIENTTTTLFGRRATQRSARTSRSASPEDEDFGTKVTVLEDAKVSQNENDDEPYGDVLLKNRITSQQTIPTNREEGWLNDFSKSKVSSQRVIPTFKNPVKPDTAPTKRPLSGRRAYIPPTQLEDSIHESFSKTQIDEPSERTPPSRTNTMSQLSKAAQLHQAAQNDNISLVKFLVQDKSNINLPWQDKATPLFSGGEHSQVCQLLVDAGCNLEATNEYGLTALQYWSEQSNSTHAVRNLVKLKADVNTADPNGMTALHYACTSSNAGAVDILLDAGAEREATTKDGLTPLFFAIDRHLRDLLVDPWFDYMLQATMDKGAQLSKLATYGANLNARNGMDRTALMECSMRGNANGVSMLLQNGASHELTTQGGISAILWAHWTNNQDCMKAFQEYNAKMNQADSRALRHKSRWLRVDKEGSVAIALDLKTNQSSREVLFDPELKGLERRMAEPKSSATPFPNCLPEGYQAPPNLFKHLENVGKSIQVWGPNGLDMSSILWHARVFVCNKVAQGGNLHPVHILALYCYTYNCDLGPSVLGFIRKPKPQSLLQWGPVIYHVQAALTALPGVSITAFRGVRGPTTSEYEEGSVVYWPMMTSMSVSYKVATKCLHTNQQQKTQGIVFVVHCKSVRPIRDYSSMPMEQEVISPNPMELVVKSIRKVIPGSNWTSFPLLESTKNQDMLCIELEEVLGQSDTTQS